MSNENEKQISNKTISRIMKRKSTWMIIIISVLAVVIPLSTSTYATDQEEKMEKFCKSWDPGERIPFEDCIDVVKNSRMWGHSVNIEIKSQTLTEYYNTYGPVLDSCGKLAAISEISKDECAKYATEHPGSIGNQIIDGIKKQRDAKINKLLAEPLN